jgi:hypothetical protein
VNIATLAITAMSGNIDRQARNTRVSLNCSERSGNMNREVAIRHYLVSLHSTSWGRTFTVTSSDTLDQAVSFIAELMDRIEYIEHPYTASAISARNELCDALYVPIEYKDYEFPFD